MSFALRSRSHVSKARRGAPVSVLGVLLQNTNALRCVRRAFVLALRLRLAEGFVDLAVEVRGLQDFAGFAAVCGAYEAVALHHVDEGGGAAVADA